MASEKFIKEIREVFIKDKYSKAEVTYAMSQFRLLLEEEDIKEKYKYLNLYCNWTLHTEIAGSKTAYRIFEYITDAFIDFKVNPNEALWINDAIVEGLSLHKLLTDIINVGKEFNIPEVSKFANLTLWIAFAQVLTNVLSQRPLKFPEPMTSSATPIYNSILAKAEAAGYKKEYSVIGFQFVYPKEDPNTLHTEVITIHSKEIGYNFYGELAYINQEIVDAAYKDRKK